MVNDIVNEIEIGITPGGRITAYGFMAQQYTSFLYPSAFSMVVGLYVKLRLSGESGTRRPMRRREMRWSGKLRGTAGPAGRGNYLATPTTNKKKLYPFSNPHTNTL
jgi:hypothetical protein